MSDNIHHKTTDSYSYPDYISSHSSYHMDSIPFAQFPCLCHICSNDEICHTNASAVFFFVLIHCFHSAIVDYALDHISSISCTLSFKEQRNNSPGLQPHQLLHLTNHEV